MRVWCTTRYSRNIWLRDTDVIFEKIVKIPGDLKKEDIVCILLKFTLEKENNKRKCYYKYDLSIWSDIRIYPNGNRLI